MSRVISRYLLALLVGWALALPAWSRAPQEPPGGFVALQERQPQVALWPSVRLLADADGTLEWRQALAKLADFRPSRGAQANLGTRRDAVWLVVPVRVVDGDGRWVFSLTDPSFGEIDVHVLDADGAMLAWHRLGATLPSAVRPLQARIPAAELLLPAGRDYKLLIRLRTGGPMVLPIELSKPGVFQQQQSGSLLVYGVLFGLAVAMFAHAALGALRWRNVLFGLYALFLVALICRYVDQLGLGHQFLWSHRQGLTAMIGSLAVLLAVTVAGPFIAGTLRTAQYHRRLHRLLMAITALAGGALVLGLPGVLGPKHAQLAATALDPLIPLLVIPVALQRALRGDRLALHVLAAWSCHAAGSLDAFALSQGWLPGHGWTRQLPLAATVAEAIAWLRILGLHMRSLRADTKAQAAAVHALSAQAHTDALTGLMNRRGLEATLPATVGRARRDDMLALIMIDLDGFKAVNDRLGHAAGDRLLIEVARRLRQSLRQRDVIARLGGDEFVVLADGLKEEHQARIVCQKLIDAFATPVMVGKEPCRIGLTIGFCVAPIDGRDSAELLHRADAAMYEGKRAGRNQARRGGAASSLANAA